MELKKSPPASSSLECSVSPKSSGSGGLITQCRLEVGNGHGWGRGGPFSLTSPIPCAQGPAEPAATHHCSRHKEEPGLLAGHSALNVGLARDGTFSQLILCIGKISLSLRLLLAENEESRGLLKPGCELQPLQDLAIGFSFVTSYCHKSQTHPHPEYSINPVCDGQRNRGWFSPIHKMPKGGFFFLFKGFLLTKVAKLSSFFVVVVIAWFWFIVTFSKATFPT